MNNKKVCIKCKYKFSRASQRITNDSYKERLNKIEQNIKNSKKIKNKKKYLDKIKILRLTIELHKTYHEYIIKNNIEKLEKIIV